MGRQGAEPGQTDASPAVRVEDPVARTLRERFGHREFRTGQREIVSAMLARRDVLAVLPTGAGKSVCFQLPALLEPRPTLVVCPLIALMEDQVGGLRARGVDAVALSSVTPRERRRELLGRLSCRPPELLYVSPERLATREFVAALGPTVPSRIVVDEAHCISEWGHDFRPPYRSIGAFARAAGRPPIAAFTATATPATRDDVARALGLRRPARFVAPVDRPNLVWQVHRVRGPDALLPRVDASIRAALRGDPSGAALVYVLTRAGATAVAAELRRRGLRAGAYHGGMEGSARGRLQAGFLAGEIRVMCATSAFGMGVDHPTVRLVCHLGAPASLEAYVQEAGRAGRDGAASLCLLLPLPGDERLHAARLREARTRIAAQAGPAVARRVFAQGLVRLRAIRRYARARDCRRAEIVRYFGESPVPCAGCDRCGEAPLAPAAGATGGGRRGS